ncbi:MAG TPA: YdeI/OmpD-associated family protein [Gemmatimonadaceae bacterium]|nr:YdeI/OmpD-associated family protein [Gemmatimonadaceae bacterium]
MPAAKKSTASAKGSASSRKKRVGHKSDVKAKNDATPVRAFKTQQDFERWLEKNYQKPEGVWIRFARKSSGIKSISHPEALDTALCFGWIDALRRPESDTTYLQRFVPRRAKSLWSQINRAKALSLIESGRMRPSGHAEIERARNDGRWEAAYPSPANAEMSPEFARELDRHPKAKAFFQTVSRVNRYAVLWRLATAKTPEKRDRLTRKFIDMLEKGETLH